MSDWRERAACRGKNTKVWFPETADAADYAQTFCRTCPVRTECETAGQNEPHGIWGGKFRKQDARPHRALRPIDHGTERGYRQHYRRGEQPCQDCRDAKNAAAAADRARAEGAA